MDPDDTAAPRSGAKRRSSGPSGHGSGPTDVDGLSSEIDRSCLSDVLPIPFSADRQAAQRIMGRDDLWEN
ncbi:MAG: hypothetical protein HY698_14480 [Deltaproteobacteria bacterium]|nr:hypothetical protein [Deltaproteobacteria bacterium]